VGYELVQEITAARPLGAGPEWWLLIDMAEDADDATHLTSCGYEYMRRRTQAPRATIYRWLKKLRDAGLVVTAHRAAGGRGGGAGTGKRAVYKIVVPSEAVPVLCDLDAIADDGETALYRWPDGAARLLYVGVSGDLAVRAWSHAKRSSWMAFAAEPAVEWFPTRSAALEAERIAIETEQPLFNVQYNDTPEAERRLVEYLIKRGRLDMLAPVVSRG
jgi:DNA-binding transcriptional ArsR family regulator